MSQAPMHPSKPCNPCQARRSVPTSPPVSSFDSPMYYSNPERVTYHFQPLTEKTLPAFVEASNYQSPRELGQIHPENFTASSGQATFKSALPLPTMSPVAAWYNCMYYMDPEAMQPRCPMTESEIQHYNESMYYMNADDLSRMSTVPVLMPIRPTPRKVVPLPHPRATSSTTSIRCQPTSCPLERTPKRTIQKRESFNPYLTSQLEPQQQTELANMTKTFTPHVLFRQPSPLHLSSAVPAQLTCTPAPAWPTPTTCPFGQPTSPFGSVTSDQSSLGLLSPSACAVSPVFASPIQPQQQFREPFGGSQLPFQEHTSEMFDQNSLGLQSSTLAMSPGFQDVRRLAPHREQLAYSVGSPIAFPQDTSGISYQSSLGLLSPSAMNMSPTFPNISRLTPHREQLAYSFGTPLVCSQNNSDQSSPRMHSPSDFSISPGFPNIGPLTPHIEQIIHSLDSPLQIPQDVSAVSDESSLGLLPPSAMKMTPSFPDGCRFSRYNEQCERSFGNKTAFPQDDREQLAHSLGGPIPFPQDISAVSDQSSLGLLPPSALNTSSFQGVSQLTPHREQLARSFDSHIRSQDTSVLLDQSSLGLLPPSALDMSSGFSQMAPGTQPHLERTSTCQKQKPVGFITPSFTQPIHQLIQTSPHGSLASPILKRTSSVSDQSSLGLIPPTLLQASPAFSKIIQTPQQFQQFAVPSMSTQTWATLEQQKSFPPTTPISAQITQTVTPVSRPRTALAQMPCEDITGISEQSSFGLLPSTALKMSPRFIEQSEISPQRQQQFARPLSTMPMMKTHTPDVSSISDQSSLGLLSPGLLATSPPRVVGSPVGISLSPYLRPTTPSPMQRPKTALGLTQQIPTPLTTSAAADQSSLGLLSRHVWATSPTQQTFIDPTTPKSSRKIFTQKESPTRISGVPSQYLKSTISPSQRTPPRQMTFSPFHKEKISDQSSLRPTTIAQSPGFSPGFSQAVPQKQKISPVFRSTTPTRKTAHETLMSDQSSLGLLSPTAWATSPYQQTFDGSATNRQAHPRMQDGLVSSSPFYKRTDTPYPIEKPKSAFKQIQKSPARQDVSALSDQSSLGLLPPSAWTMSPLQQTPKRAMPRQMQASPVGGSLSPYLKSTGPPSPIVTPKSAFKQIQRSPVRQDLSALSDQSSLGLLPPSALTMSPLQQTPKRAMPRQMQASPVGGSLSPYLKSTGPPSPIVTPKSTFKQIQRSPVRQDLSALSDQSSLGLLPPSAWTMSPLQQTPKRAMPRQMQASPVGGSLSPYLKPTGPPSPIVTPKSAFKQIQRSPVRQDLSALSDQSSLGLLPPSAWTMSPLQQTPKRAMPRQMQASPVGGSLSPYLKPTGPPSPMKTPVPILAQTQQSPMRKDISALSDQSSLGLLSPTKMAKSPKFSKFAQLQSPQKQQQVQSFPGKTQVKKPTTQISPRFSKHEDSIAFSNQSSLGILSPSALAMSPGISDVNRLPNLNSLPFQMPQKTKSAIPRQTAGPSTQPTSTTRPSQRPPPSNNSADRSDLSMGLLDNSWLESPAHEGILPMTPQRRLQSPSPLRMGPVSRIRQVDQMAGRSGLIMPTVYETWDPNMFTSLPRPPPEFSNMPGTPKRSP